MKKDSTLSMMVGFTHKIKHFFLSSLITAILAMVLSFISPLVVGFTIDHVIGGLNSPMPTPLMWIFNELDFGNTLSSALIACAIIIGMFAILSGVLGYMSRVSMAKGSEKMINNLRTSLFSHTQSLPFEWHTSNKTGDIIQRCTSDVETVRRFVFNQLIEVIRTLILVVIAIIIMFSLNVTMATVVTAFIPLIVFYSFYYFKRIAHKFHEADESEGVLTTRVQENLTGVRVVRAFGRERYETERFDEQNIDFTNKWDAMGKILGVYWCIGDIVSQMQILFVLVAGAFLATVGDFTFGELIIFLSYAYMLSWPVRTMGRIISEMSRAGVSLKRLKEIFDAKQEGDNPDSGTPPINRDIEFKNVSFTYDEQPVLKDVNFKIKSGTTFGILGSTGSGKSTITYLLNRLYDLPSDSGSITIGGVNVSQIKKEHLRKNIGLVLQEPFLFSKTIKENIDIAVRNDNIDEIRGKAQIAAVDENIMSFVKGYDTIVGERGVTLSGGQKQRVAIARTLMMNAPVMVFDDSMSALDMETDAQIRESLRKDTQGATVILISHRISTLMKADVIAVLEEGEVAEIGSHAELVAQNGIYRRIYDLQSGYTKDVDFADDSKNKSDSNSEADNKITPKGDDN